MPGANTEDTAAYDKDRERFYAQHQELSRSFGLGLEDSKPSTINEVYARCADDVVALTKCVDAAGPTWYFQCGEPFIALQKCYDKNKTWKMGNPLATLTQWKDQIAASATVRMEHWQWWWDDLTKK